MSRWNIAQFPWYRQGFARCELVTGYADGSGLGIFAVPCVKREWRIVHTQSGYELTTRAEFKTLAKARVACEAVAALNLDFNGPREAFGAATANAVYAVLREHGINP